MAHILLVTAERVGTKQTKNIALDLTSYTKSLENTLRYWKKAIARNPDTNFSNCSSFFANILLGTVKDNFVDGDIVDSVVAKKIEAISKSGSVAVGSDGFEFRFSYLNVGSCLKVEVSFEQVGIKKPDFKKIAELMNKQKEIEEQLELL